MRWVKGAVAILVVVIALDVLLWKSGYMLLVHDREVRANELINTPRFGNVGGSATALCTYWTGRSFQKFFFPPKECSLLSRPTDFWIGK